ncbi:MAG: hypothetical protein ABIJ86_15070 [Spirochaetota bacterium]
MYGILFVASAATGGLGFAMTPVLWKTGPDKKRLEAGIKEPAARVEVQGL